MTQELTTFGTKSMVDRLVAGASQGLSAQELSDSVRGVLTPDECVEIVRKALAEKDVWDTTERKQLLLIRLTNLADDLAESFADTGDIKNADILLKTLSAVSKELEKHGRVTEEDLKVISEAQAREVIAFYTMVLARVKETLTMEYPDVDPVTLERHMVEGVGYVSRERYRL